MIEISKLTSQLTELVGGGVMGEIMGAFERMDWAETAIKRAMRAHPSVSDDLWHAFKLLVPTHDLMSTRFVYESHVHELLARVAVGEDTRPPTWAEIACCCSQTSLLGPLTDAGAGLYFRAFFNAFPDQPQFIDQISSREHYEALHGAEMDSYEAEIRRKLTRADRVVGDVECCGRHNGKPVRCRYAAREAA